MCRQKVNGSRLEENADAYKSIARFAEQDLYVVLGRLVQRFRLEYGAESGTDNRDMGQVGIFEMT